MILALNLAGSGWIVTITWTLSLGVMGGACAVNARGYGRTHCYYGPFFLIMAVASLAYGLQLLLLGPQGWQYLSAIVLVSGGLLYFVPDWL